MNHIPVLATVGFFDVESRGAFQGYQALKRDGARLLVLNGHDGAVAGTDGGAKTERRWYDRYLRGVRNGVLRKPRVRLYLADGDREDFSAGKFVRYSGTDWPIPRTHWRTLHLGADGSLGLRRSAETATQSYATLPSLPTQSDPANAGIVGSTGANAITTALPILSDMTVAEASGLSWTTAPLDEDVLSAGPAAFDVRLSSTASETGIWAVISDVSPDGTPHPVASGRLLSSFPGVRPRRSLRAKRSGAIVQPYGRYGAKDPAPPGTERTYHVEFWPIGNRFKAGHRLRLTVSGDVGGVGAGRPGGQRRSGRRPGRVAAARARAAGQRSARRSDAVAVCVILVG